jgi:hypothetical protein
MPPTCAMTASRALARPRRGFPAQARSGVPSQGTGRENPTLFQERSPWRGSPAVGRLTDMNTRPLYETATGGTGSGGITAAAPRDA